MVWKKQEILDEIRRRAEENGGVPLGWTRFKRVTGMRLFAWYGKYWRRWSEATAAAGLTPNTMSRKYSDEQLFESLVVCIRALGRYPVPADLLIRRQNDTGFPSLTAFRRLGNRPEIIRKLVDYCSTKHAKKEDACASSSYDDVLTICVPLLEELAAQPKPRKRNGRKPGNKPKPRSGFVYLFESAGLYKIGFSYDVLRRGRELSWLLPEKGKLVHVIRTNDPRGIEAYWHGRFQGKRAHAEWFHLNERDVEAFKSLRTM